MVGKLSRRLSCWLIGGILVAGSPLPAQESVLPFFVVEDSNGDVLGPVVGLTGLNGVAIRLNDSSIGKPVFLEVRNENVLLGPLRFTYFSGADCTGAAYHNPTHAPTHSGIGALTGFAYSVARLGASQWLIRSENGTSLTAVTIQSIFESHHNSCNNSTFDANYRAATKVMDLDAAHPPSYSVR